MRRRGLFHSNSELIHIMTNVVYIYPNYSLTLFYTLNSQRKKN